MQNYKEILDLMNRRFFSSIRKNKRMQSGHSLLELIGVLGLVGVLGMGAVSLYGYTMDGHKAEVLYEDIKTRLILSSEHKGRIFSTDLRNISTFGLPIITERDKPVAGFNKVTVSNVKEKICARLLKKEWPEGARIYIDGYIYGEQIHKCPAEDCVFAVAAHSATLKGVLPLPCSNDDDCDGCSFCVSRECIVGCPEGQVCFGFNEENKSCQEGACDENGLCCPTEPPVCPLDAIIEGSEEQCACVCPDHRDTTDGLCGDCESGSYTPWTQPNLTSWDSYGSVTSTTIYGGYSYMTSSCTRNIHVPWCAFNGVYGNADKYLSSNTSYGNITWALPTILKISSFKVYTTTESSFLGRFPRTITIEGSMDGVNWQEIVSETLSSYPASGQFVELIPSSPVTVMYLRWTFGPSFNAANGVAIAEIRMNAEELVSFSKYTLDNETLTCVEQETKNANQPCNGRKNGKVCCNQEEGLAYICNGETLSLFYSCDESQTDLWNTSCDSMNEASLCDEEGDECERDGYSGICVRDYNEGELHCCDRAIDVETGHTNAVCCQAAIDYEQQYNYYDNKVDNFSYNDMLGGVPVEVDENRPNGLCCLNSWDLVSDNLGDEMCGQMTAAYMRDYWGMYCNSEGAYEGRYCCDNLDLSTSYGEPSATCCDYLKQNGWGDLDWVSSSEDDSYGSCCSGPWSVWGSSTSEIDYMCCQNFGGEPYYDDVNWTGYRCCQGAVDMGDSYYYGSDRSSDVCCRYMGGTLDEKEYDTGWGWTDWTYICIDSETNCPMGYEACNNFGEEYGCAWNEENSFCEPVHQCEDQCQMYNSETEQCEDACTPKTWLQSSGALLDTGILFDYSKTNVINATVRFMGSNINSRYIIAGTFNCSNAANFELSGSKLRLYLWNGGRDDRSTASASLNTDYDFSFSYNPSTKSYTGNLGSIQINSSFTQATNKITPNTIALFYDWRSNSTSTFYPIRYYSYSHTVNGTMVQDLVPVLSPRGDACMYDKITKKLFCNRNFYTD